MAFSFLVRQLLAGGRNWRRGSRRHIRGCAEDNILGLEPKPSWLGPYGTDLEKISSGSYYAWGVVKSQIGCSKVPKSGFYCTWT